MTSTSGIFSTDSANPSEQKYETASVILQRNNAALKAALTDFGKKIHQIDAKVFGEQQENFKEKTQKTVADLLNRLDIANNIGFINLQPFIDILKYLPHNLYEQLGLTAEPDNCIFVLCDYIRDCIGLRVVQNILPKDFQLTEKLPDLLSKDQTTKNSLIEAAIEFGDGEDTDFGPEVMIYWIKYESLVKKSVKTAIDLLEEFWQISLPRSEFNTSIIGLDADGTGILACNTDGFDLNDFLWRYIIDSLSVTTKTILLLASWRICQVVDKREAKKCNTVEFFPALSQIVKRISALGYNFEFNPALLIDFLYQQEPGINFRSSEEKYVSQDKPMLEVWPDKLIFVFYHLHHLNLIKANDKVLYVLIDDSKEIIERLQFMLTKCLTKIPKQVTVTLKHFSNNIMSSMYQPTIAVTGLGEIQPNICGNINLLLYFSCLADQTQNTNFWLYIFNQTFHKTLDGFRDMFAQNKKLPFQSELLEKIHAVVTQELHFGTFEIFNLYGLLQFIGAGWQREKQDLTLPECLSRTYPNFCHKMIAYLNGIAVYLYAGEYLTQAKEIKELEVIMHNTSTVNDAVDQKITEYKKMAESGDFTASWKLAYILSKCVDEKDNYSDSHIKQLEQYYVPALLDKKTAIPPDILWNLLVPYRQSLRITASLWLLLEKLYGNLFVFTPKLTVRMMASASSSSVTSSSFSTITSAASNSIHATTTTTLTTATAASPTLFFASNAEAKITQYSNSLANDQAPNNTPQQNVASDTTIKLG